jgi:hypothetical protein
MSERFRLADAVEWVADDGLDQLKKSERQAPIGPHPVGEIFAKLWLKDGFALRRT